MIDFPSVSPTKRKFTPGEYPVRRFDSISGAGTTRLYGSKAFNATLDLEFVQDDAGTASILKSWNDSLGGAKILTLPATVFEGINGPQDQIPTYLNWRWGKVPVVNSLFPGRSRIQVALVATLDG
tara:strand:+ start:3223 stop:3597 length:375 start_codon:yes stop_codon:yes gene_type:complete